MQEVLKQRGIDTVWFGVAADLNDFFADRSNLLMTSEDFMNDLGVALYEQNRNTFNQLVSGEIGISGQKLDNFLVNREQMAVQKFVSDKYGSSVPALIRGPVNLAFSVGRFTLKENIRAGVNYVEDRYKSNFNFWNTAHRIELGESMMSQERHKDKL